VCGIIGYEGQAGALPLVAKGLKNLEYRGYDSAGIALCENGTLSVYKQAGVIDDLEFPSSSPATRAIGHTRWSTHGKPTDANAHPHTDCTGSIALVHNGIIENYLDIKAELEGHTFKSETDSEVIAHLIEEEYEGDLRAAFEAAVSKLEGSFAIAVAAAGHEGLYAARQDSPLVIGLGSDGNFIASDVTAFIEHTQEVAFLEDGDIAHITGSSVTVYADGSVVDRETQVIDWEAEAAEKAGYSHYMLKEIHEQPRSIRQTLAGRLDDLSAEPELELDLPKEYLRSLADVQIVAAGTSYHAGLYAKHLLEHHMDVRVSVEVASEYTFNGGRDPWRTLVIGVSQSGETADTIQAIRRAKRAGGRTLAVTNTIGSSITREVDDTLLIRAGPEIGVAASKTFTSQVAALALLTTWLGRKSGRMPTDEASDLLESLRRLPGAIQQVLDRESDIEAVADRYASSQSYFFIGRRLGYPVALEGALKLKEISYAHAEGFPAGELKHGPLALVSAATPVLAVLTEGACLEATLNNVKEVESREAPVIGITTDSDVEKYLDEMFVIPRVGDLSPLVANVYFQLFSYHVAKSMGRSIDKPRNLAKSVTVV
jgi:glucosamine--fructose-6-phosphate aminotransferase (isomerizing)